jgi:predicted Rossmann fold nucleotide-binding protein DprA/Smf involved in DNA uptake
MVQSLSNRATLTDALSGMNPSTFGVQDSDYPIRLRERLQGAAPERVMVLGSVPVLSLPKTALFCSARTPGDAILRAHDTARHLRDSGVTVISGFHSPIERDCLKILLRGRQAIIICLARALDSMRVPAECRAAFNAGRILFLSPFPKQPRRVTKYSVVRRNEVVAALADDAYVAHAESGGRTDQVLRKLHEWEVPVL